jgi:glycosyltransferase involved in cell wall biosynthesis
VLNDSGFVNGGAAKVALSEARAFADAGFQVHLVCGVGPVASDLRDVPNLTIHCLDIADVNEDGNRLRAMTHVLWNPRSYRYIKSLLQLLEANQTVVHVHSWTRALSSSAVKAATDSGHAVVVTLHDYLLACPQGTLFLQHTQQKCTIQPMSLACISTNCDARSYQHKLWRVARKLVQTELARFPSAVKHYIYLSRISLDLIKPHLPAGSTFHPIANPIDVEHLPLASVESNDCFLFIGRLVPEKGGVLFAKAAAAEGITAQFIGDGPERNAIAAAYPRAVLSGWMNHGEGMTAMRSGRALVFPSLWYEALGLTVLEAAAHGLPSIVPDACAASESVIDGITGLHFKSGDEASLRAKMRQLNDPAVASRMGRAAYDRFWSLPGLEMKGHVQQLHQVYCAMIQGKVSSSSEFSSMESPSKESSSGLALRDDLGLPLSH